MRPLSRHNMYELEVNDKLSKNMKEMKDLVNKIMVDYDDDYNENMTQEERDWKSKMDFYLWNEELCDDEYVNTDDFYDFLDE